MTHSSLTWPPLIAQEILLIFISYVNKIFHVAQDQKVRTLIHFSQALVYKEASAPLQAKTKYQKILLTDQWGPALWEAADLQLFPISIRSRVFSSFCWISPQVQMLLHFYKSPSTIFNVPPQQNATPRILILWDRGRANNTCAGHGQPDAPRGAGPEAQEAAQGQAASSCLPSAWAAARRSVRPEVCAASA